MDLGLKILEHFFSITLLLSYTSYFSLLFGVLEVCFLLLDIDITSYQSQYYFINV